MAQLTIQELERATGILRDTLRVWERRYGFPAPSRNIYGERLYDQQTVERLLMITKLLDAGYRIGKLATLSREGLLALIPTPTHHVSQDVDRLLEIIRCLKPGLVYDELMQLKERFGVRHFIYELIAPLTQAVGEAWFQGRIGVLEEHTYSEQAVQILKEIVHQTPVSTDKKILMATLPGEQHVVGLLMASCVCALEGLGVLYVGPQTPLDDIVRGAVSAGCCCVGISSSPHGNRRVVAQQLVRTRRLLPSEIALWVGGAGVASIPVLPPAIQRFSDLRQIGQAVSRLV